MPQLEGAQPRPRADVSSERCGAVAGSDPGVPSSFQCSPQRRGPLTLSQESFTLGHVRSHRWQHDEIQQGGSLRYQKLQNDLKMSPPGGLPWWHSG